MKNVFKNLGRFVEGAVFILLAIVVLTYPFGTITLLVNFTGWVLLLTGIFALIQYFMSKGDELLSSLDAVQSVLSIIFGVIFIFGNSPSIAVFIAYLLILWFLVTSVLELFITIKAPISTGLKILSTVLNGIVIVISLWALFTPSLALNIFVWTIAVMFISLGINKFVSMFVSE